MHYLEPASSLTLAAKLGDVPHVSGLAIRLARVTRAGKRLPEWLMKVAIERGAKHYQRSFSPPLPEDNPEVSDEEVGVALCLGEYAYDLDRLRAAVQLLSSPRINPARLSRLAVQERCEPVLLHAAGIAEGFDPNLQPWAFLRQHLSARLVGAP